MDRSLLCIITGIALTLPAIAYAQAPSEKPGGRITVITPKPNPRAVTPNILDPNASAELTPPRSAVAPTSVSTVTIRREPVSAGQETQATGHYSGLKRKRVRRPLVLP